MLKHIDAPYAYVKDEIHKLDPDTSSEVVLDRNFAFMQEFVSKDLPQKLLTQILNEPDLLQEVASRSYEHVNHFSKIVIVDNPNLRGYRLTVHIWLSEQAEKAQNEELIHDHRFSFWSHIFCGEMISENFVEADKKSYERKDFRRYVYRPSKTGNIHTCDFDSDAQLIRLEDKVVSKGDIYHLNYLTTHRVVFPRTGGCLCTFVLRGPRERNYCHTYNTFYPDRGTTSSVPMMTPAELRAKIETVLEARS